MKIYFKEGRNPFLLFAFACFSPFILHYMETLGVNKFTLYITGVICVLGVIYEVSGIKKQEGGK